MRVTCQATPGTKTPPAINSRPTARIPATCQVSRVRLFVAARNTAAGSPPPRLRRSRSTGRTGLVSGSFAARCRTSPNSSPSPSTAARPPSPTPVSLVPTSASRAMVGRPGRARLGNGGLRLVRQHPGEAERRAHRALPTADPAAGPGDPPRRFQRAPPGGPFRQPPGSARRRWPMPSTLSPNVTEVLSGGALDPPIWAATWGGCALGNRLGPVATGAGGHRKRAGRRRVLMDTGRPFRAGATRQCAAAVSESSHATPSGPRRS